MPRRAEHSEVRRRQHQLEQQLLPLGQSLVLMPDQLAVIVDKADGGIAQREQNRQRQRDQTPPLTADGAEHGVARRCQQERQNKADAAHSGGSRLGLVPMGPSVRIGCPSLKCRRTGRRIKPKMTVRISAQPPVAAARIPSSEVESDPMSVSPLLFPGNR